MRGLRLRLSRSWIATSCFLPRPVIWIDRPVFAGMVLGREQLRGWMADTERGGTVSHTGSDPMLEQPALRTLSTRAQSAQRAEELVGLRPRRWSAPRGRTWRHAAARVGSSAADVLPARDAAHRLGFGPRPVRVGAPGPAGKLPGGGVHGTVGRLLRRHRHRLRSGRVPSRSSVSMPGEGSEPDPSDQSSWRMRSGRCDESV